MFDELEEFVAPIAEALVAVAGLFAVGACVVLEPIDEQILVFLQHQKLKTRKEGLDNSRSFTSANIEEVAMIC